MLLYIITARVERFNFEKNEIVIIFHIIEHVGYYSIDTETNFWYF